MNATDLYDELNNVGELLLSTRRALADLRRAYARLDVAEIGVDDLGPSRTAAEILSAVRREASLLADNLDDGDDRINDVRKFASRLYTQTKA